MIHIAIRPGLTTWIRIAISPAAFDAICATLPVGSVGVWAETNERSVCQRSSASGNVV